MKLYSMYEGHVFPHLEEIFTGRLRSERGRVLSFAQGILLEIGAGAGQNFDYLSDQVEGCVALEPSPAFIRKAGRNIAASDQSGKIRIIRGRAENLPLASESVDTALSFLVFCSVQNPKRALREIYRVLKPGGRLLFFEHVLSGSPKVARWQNRINPLWKRIGCGCHLNRDTAAEIVASGFTFQNLYVYRSPHLGPPITSHVIEGVAVKTGFPRSEE